MKRLFAAAAAVILLCMISGCEGKLPPNTVFSPADAAGRRIGVRADSAAAALVAGAGQVYAYYSDEGLMADLKAGAVDCVIMEGGAARELVGRTPRVMALEEPYLSFDLRIAVAKENADLLAAVNTALDALSADGTLANIIAGYTAGSGYRYASPADAEAPRESLRAAFRADFPPYTYKTEDGEYAGIDIDLARAVCDRLRVGLAMAELPQAELESAVMFGRAELALGGLHAGDAQTDTVSYSNGYSMLELLVIVRR